MDKGKNAFYQAYPDYETFTLENQSTFTGNQDTKEKMIEALYNYYVSAYSYDYNYKAD